MKLLTLLLWEEIVSEEHLPERGSIISQIVMWTSVAMLFLIGMWLMFGR